MNDTEYNSNDLYVLNEWHGVQFKRAIRPPMNNTEYNSNELYVLQWTTRRTKFNESNVITLSEFGFLSGDSTTNQLLCVYGYLGSNFDERITTQSVYFDIFKAFDRVWHRGLILKPESIGVRGKLLKWFYSSVTDCTQASVIKREKSVEKRIPCSVSINDV